MVSMFATILDGSSPVHGILRTDNVTLILASILLARTRGPHVHTMKALIAILWVTSGKLTGSAIQVWRTGGSILRPAS